MLFGSNSCWLLIQGRLPSLASSLKVFAVLEYENSVSRVPLAVSFKGTLYDVLKCEQPLLSIRFEAHSNGVEIGVDISYEKITFLHALFIMSKRRIGEGASIDATRKKRMNIGWGSFLIAPYATYMKITSLRYHYPPPHYESWREEFWQLSPKVERQLRSFVESESKEAISVVIEPHRERQAGRSSDTPYTPLDQIGMNPNVKVLDADAQLDLPNEGWTLLMQPSQRLEPWALAWFLATAKSRPQAEVIYSDHDRLDANGHFSPVFKPDWSPELQRVTNYMGGCLLVKNAFLSKLQKALGYCPGSYELTLEAADQLTEAQVEHITAVLWHEQGADPCALADVLQRHFDRKDTQASVQPDHRGFLRIRYPLPVKPPKISILVPTRDMLNLLKPCVESILEKTTWPDYEILIIDNQSSCLDTLGYMARIDQHPAVRVIKYDEVFNFSAINNFAVEHAKGEYICLLNNDTEVISPDWLEEMASRLMQTGVGAVGARLYFTDGRVQHAGDVVGIGGCANHIHGIIEANDPGYMSRAVLPQELSAVTAACLLTPRDLYLSLGGLDEQNLTVAFNDVDYCLRVREAGYRVLYTPYAELYHHESVSRGKDDSPEKKARAKREVDYMRRRWEKVMTNGDPYYNPNLNQSRPDFTLGKCPGIDWPW